jgi:hypothetical protein
MELENAVNIVQDLIEQFTPLLRVTWVITVLIGIVMVVTALILKRNPARKISPWIVGIFGAVMTVSSGTQLLFSLVK